MTIGSNMGDICATVGCDHRTDSGQRFCMLCRGEEAWGYTTPTRYPTPEDLRDTVAVKPSNPKDLIGSDKLPLHLWPTTATALGSIGLLEGMLKYGRTNWRESGVRASIYYDAARRHLDAWFEGEDLSPDAKIPHLANALACIAIIVDAQASDQLVDDRAYRGQGYRKLVEELTPYVPHLKELFKDKHPKHYTRLDEPDPKAE